MNFSINVCVFVKCCLNDIMQF